MNVIKSIGGKNWGLIILFVLGLFVILNTDWTKRSLAYPIVYDISDQTSFSCESLMSSGIWSDEIDDFGVDGIVGSVRKGTDNVAMKIKNDETLIFLTRAGVEVGATEGVEYNILRNDIALLVAIYFDGRDTDVVTMDKTTGLTLWTRHKSSFIGTMIGDVYQLICR